MSIYEGVNGAKRPIREFSCGVNGVKRNMSQVWIGINGVKKQLFSSEIRLKDLQPGSIIQLRENNILTDFYVGIHNYEVSLNGEGRTLVFRKDSYGQLPWSESYINAYKSSTIDNQLNNQYKNKLDTNIQGLINTTKFYYTIGNGNNSIGILERPIFLLSAYELGQSSNWFNNEGTTLPNANNYHIAYNNGIADVWWTRTPQKDNAYRTVCFIWDGSISAYDTVAALGVRPAFTLPSDFIIL